MTLLSLDALDTTTVEGYLRCLTPATWRELARGPLPEPECRLCQTMCTLHDIGLLPEASTEADAAIALMDYHELHEGGLADIRMFMLMSGIPATGLPTPMHHVVNDMIGTMLYHRCQLIYEIARRLALQED